MFDSHVVFSFLFCTTAQDLHDHEQAYTHELENKVSRLEEENERLKRQKVYSIYLYRSALLSYQLSKNCLILSFMFSDVILDVIMKVHGM